MANEKILAAFQCTHDDGDLLVVVGATTEKEFRAAVVDAELVRMHAHEEGTEHDQPLHAFAAWRFDEKDKRHVWDLDVEKDTSGARPAMVANAYWAEACEFVASQMHAKLLSMLGAKDHVEAGGIIGKLQAGAMHAAQEAVQQSSESIDAIVTSLGAAWLLSTRGDWGPGDTLGETVARGAAVDSYKVADFRHADDAKFCALAHANLPRLLNELEALRRSLASPTKQGLDDRNVFERAYAQHAINYAGLDAPVEQIIQRIKDGRDGNRYAHMHDAGAWVGWNLAIATQAKQEVQHES